MKDKAKYRRKHTKKKSPGKEATRIRGLLDPEVSEYDAFEDDFVRYSRRMGAIDADLRGLYSGPGQCEGVLVHDTDRVIICCCRRLADAICYGGAHVHDGFLFFRRDPPEFHDDGQGGTYMIEGAPSAYYLKCPFCEASLLPHARIRAEA